MTGPPSAVPDSSWAMVGSAIVFVTSCVISVLATKQQQQQHQHARRYCSRNACATTTTTTTTTKKSSTTTRSSSPLSLSKAEVLALRKEYFSSSLSVSYANSNPLMIVKGQGSRLIDETGTSYLDTRNNVAHVGHNNPRVIQNVQEQVATLNTNTRYLHPNMVVLAQRLTALLPSPLNVVFFCNSGSEANDLALRLARVYSGGSTNTVVVDGAYHGHTLANLEVSPYKYEKGTEHKLEDVTTTTTTAHCGYPVPGQNIWKVPAPDTYRGPHRNIESAGQAYASHVVRACQYYQKKGEKVRAFMVEGGMSVAGVILPPPGYLQACCEAVHQAGGLYIADEVQTGLGRFGSSLWAFQHEWNQDSQPDVVPDIVTIGKPFGNGMPLAAVVTSRIVAERFDACGVEYFNTFAGNPVCAAAGLAVLDELEMRRLQQHALDVGNHLKSRFRSLMDTIPLIGDVRGSGLFLGVELVKDRSTQMPATAETSYICSVLKSKYHILTSIDGFSDNVLVIKPPMVFSREDADLLVDSFAKAVREDLSSVSDLSRLAKTPT